MRNALWDDIYPKLVAFAVWEVERYVWHTDTLPKGHTPESIVQEAIEKTFSEDKNWDPERGELLPWLKWVIKGDIDRLYHSASHPKKFYVVGLSSIEEGEDNTALDKVEYKENKYLEDGHMSKSPDDIVATEESRKEKASLTKSKIDALIGACHDRPDLEEIVYAITGGKCSSDAQSLAKYLGRPIRQIYQQLRTLRRKATKIRTENREWIEYGQE